MKKPDYMKYDGRTPEPPYAQENAPSSCTVDSIVLCPVCQRGDVWQEAVNRTQYVYKGETVKDGQEVIDYLLAEVATLLETQNADIERPMKPQKEGLDMGKNDGAASLVRSDALLESAFLMNNTELAAAIDRAYQSAGSLNDMQILWATHLEILLKIQRTRAAYIRDSNVPDEGRGIRRLSCADEQNTTKGPDAGPA